MAYAAESHRRYGGVIDQQSIAQPHARPRHQQMQHRRSESDGDGGTVLTKMSPKGKNSAGRAMLVQADPRIPASRVIQVGEALDADYDWGIVRFWL